MLINTLFRALAPVVFGSIFSWSLRNIKDVEGNKNALGFPFNQYFAFFVMSILSFINMIYVSQFPERLNRKRDIVDQKNTEST